MSFNGSGVFQRLFSWTNDAAANIKIRADRMDAEFNGIATGLSTCITKDGQTTIMANLPMSGYRFTNVGDAALTNEYATLGQLNTAVSNIQIDDLTDVTITSLTSGDFLYYNGTAWINVAKNIVPIDGIKTTGASGVVLKNSGGTTVATFGASNGTVSTLAGNLAVGGTASAIASLDIAGNSTAAAFLTLAEDTDNGTNKVTITAPQTIASDYTITLPSAAGTLATVSDIDDAKIQLQTAVVASGTAINFTSIPSTVKRITVMLVGVSLSGTDNILIQIGDSGGLETTGYSGSAGTQTTGVSTVNLSSGFLALHSDPAGAISGMIVLQLFESSSNTWVAHGGIGSSNSPRVSSVGGHKALSATLDRISLVPSGANTFDAGSVSISWEK